jgi:phosphatidylserine/phosphatidylglycerophosphate/cardiolipin synthase-like enzyme
LINRANRSVYVAVYSFTRDSLATALISAKERGVEVRVVIERERAYEHGSEYPRLKSAGVDVRLDGNPNLMHHKFMVIDGYIVVTGSYNWSSAAEDRNDENIVVILDRDVAQRFVQEFERVWQMAST